jgi:hypothetical protein
MAKVTSQQCSLLSTINDGVSHGNYKITGPIRVAVKLENVFANEELQWHLSNTGDYTHYYYHSLLLLFG